MARESKRWFGAGSGHVDPYADTAGDGAPVDIAAVRRDDALIDAIASDGPVATDSTGEYQVAALLANWRAEITAPPMPAAPDMDAIVAAVNQEIGARDARVSGGHKLRLVRPIAGAAAAIALVVGGMTAVSYGAQPGDPLWKVKEVVFSDQASSTVANSDATADLEQAEQLIASGNVAEAKTYLDRASSRVGDVKDDAARQELLARWEKLKAELQKKAAPAPAETSTSSSAAATTSSSAPGTTDTTTDSTSVPPSTVEPPPLVPPIIQIPPEIQSIIPSFPPPPAETTVPPTILLGPAPTTTVDPDSDSDTGSDNQTPTTPPRDLAPPPATSTTTTP